MMTRSLRGMSNDAQSDSPSSLCEKYRPREIGDFIGLERPKQLLQNFAAKPFGCAWLFVGRSGTGKTAMARALASAISAEIHHMPADQCTRENVARVWAICQNEPSRGFKRHLILVDQADRLSKPHQSDLRSKLEGKNLRPNIVWVFTAHDSDDLDDGFRSRCLEVKFSSYGIAKDAATLLELIWDAERPAGDKTRPNFARIIKEANNNIRTALREIELKLGTFHLEGNKNSHISAKPARPRINLIEVGEHLDSVRHNVLDHISSELAALEKYLKSKGVSSDAVQDLDVFRKQQEDAWDAIAAEIKGNLEK
jgi:replication-associated recombination protein RarA